MVTPTAGMKINYYCDCGKTNVLTVSEVVHCRRQETTICVKEPLCSCDHISDYFYFFTIPTFGTRYDIVNDIRPSTIRYG